MSEAPTNAGEGVLVAIQQGEFGLVRLFESELRNCVMRDDRMGGCLEAEGGG